MLLYFFITKMLDERHYSVLSYLYDILLDNALNMTNSTNAQVIRALPF